MMKANHQQNQEGRDFRQQQLVNQHLTLFLTTGSSSRRAAATSAAATAMIEQEERSTGITSEQLLQEGAQWQRQHNYHSITDEETPKPRRSPQERKQFLVSILDDVMSILDETEEDEQNHWEEGRRNQKQENH